MCLSSHHYSQRCCSLKNFPWGEVLYVMSSKRLGHSCRTKVVCCKWKWSEAEAKPKNVPFRKKKIKEEKEEDGGLARGTPEKHGWAKLFDGLSRLLVSGPQPANLWTTSLFGKDDTCCATSLWPWCPENSWCVSPQLFLHPTLTLVMVEPPTPTSPTLHRSITMTFRHRTNCERNCFFLRR